jgi:citrate lyase synthetase
LAELAIEIAGGRHTASFKVVDPFGNGHEFLVAQAERGKGFAQEFVVRSERPRGKLPLNLTPHVGS